MDRNFARDDAVVRLIASDKNWIDGEAVRQLEKTMDLEGVTRAVGMPDLHAGRGYPIGAAIASDGFVHPRLVGSDIGCGMALYRTDLDAAKPKLDKWASRLALDTPWNGDAAAFLEARGLSGALHASALGTIGGGNHFAELQRIEELLEVEPCRALGLDQRALCLLAHSGSRSLGEAIAQAVRARGPGDAALAVEGEAARTYLDAHDRAVRWASANRALIAERFLEATRSEGDLVFDLPHNSVTPRLIDGRIQWLHRKGASPADAGPLVVPGSRGARSYLVEPIGDQAQNLFSLAHGAGRKWRRSDARARLEKRFRPKDLEKTALGSRVICDDKALIYEEAPEAYKSIDVVIDDMARAGLIRVLAILRPVLTYKTKTGDGAMATRRSKR